MKLKTQTYEHEATGITAEISFEEKLSHYGEDRQSIIKKKITIKTSDGDKEFIFEKSNAETIKKVGEAFLEIAELAKNL